ncbi:MAG: hypothetical protein ACYC8T_38350 [Myxococcaceae bacterium]
MTPPTAQLYAFPKSPRPHSTGMAERLRSRIHLLLASCALPDGGHAPERLGRVCRGPTPGWIDGLREALRLARHDRNSTLAPSLFIEAMTRLEHVSAPGIPAEAMTAELLDLLWGIGGALRGGAPLPGVTAAPFAHDRADALLFEVLEATVRGHAAKLDSMTGEDALRLVLGGGLEGLPPADGVCGVAALFFLGGRLDRAAEFIAAGHSQLPSHELLQATAALVWMALRDIAVGRRRALRRMVLPSPEGLLAVLTGSLDYRASLSA